MRSIYLFSFSAKEICKEHTDDDSEPIWNDTQKCNPSRCAVTGMLDSTEHIAVIIGNYNAHKVRKYQCGNKQKITNLFHNAYAPFLMLFIAQRVSGKNQLLYLTPSLQDSPKVPPKYA